MIPPGEKVIETKICALSGEEFIITDKDLEFYDRISPAFGGKKYNIPSPTLSPEERQRRRFTWRNERSLYKRKCDLTGQEIISIYSPDKPYTIYNHDAWWSDDWSPYDSGQKIDFNKSFFEQFNEVLLKTPLQPLYLNRSNSVNSDYTNHCGEMKDSYMTFASWACEELQYCSQAKGSKGCVDCMGVFDSENCYECVTLEKAHTCFFCQNIQNSRDLWFSKDCRSCRNCIFCTNLVNKEYHIYNQPVSKEEYEKKEEELRNTNLQLLKEKFKNISDFAPAGYVINCENCTGDQVTLSGESHIAFEVQNVYNTKYVQNGGMNAKYIHDAYGFGFDLENAYEIIDSGVQSSSQLFCLAVHGTSQATYAVQCQQGNDLFGCISLRHKSHSILNTAYSKAEYEENCAKLVDHMISTGEWGEFFPQDLSPYGYNETIAQDYFPSNKDEIVSLGWKWHHEDIQKYTGENIVPLPIREYDERVVGAETARKNIDELLAKPVVCEVTEKAFKIIKQELIFYIENNLPIPRKHPEQRHIERFKLRNPRKLWDRECDKCGVQIFTTYSPDRKEKVYCEDCYRETIY